MMLRSIGQQKGKAGVPSVEIDDWEVQYESRLASLGIIVTRLSFICSERGAAECVFQVQYISGDPRDEGSIEIGLLGSSRRMFVPHSALTNSADLTKQSCACISPALSVGISEHFNDAA
jgi:hypothetical protein